MLAVYAVSVVIDKAFFGDLVIGTSPAGRVVAELAVHTVLIGVYLAAVAVIVKAPAKTSKSLSAGRPQ